MAIQYANGTPYDHEDLLAKLAVHAVSCGWSLDKQTTDELYIHSSGSSGTKSLYFSFKAGDISGDGYIRVKGNTGFDSGSAWDSQPGAITTAGHVPLLTSPMVRYWMTGTDDYITLVCNITGDYFQHLHFGCCSQFIDDAYGNFFVCHSSEDHPQAYTYLDTAYCYGIYSVQNFYDGVAWRNLCIDTNEGAVNTYEFDDSKLLYFYTNGFIGNMLLPIKVINRSSAYNIGYARDVYYGNIGSGLAYGGYEIQYNTMKFLLFPFLQLGETLIMGGDCLVAVRIE